MDELPGRQHGVYISPLDFSVSNVDSRITIPDGSGAVVFGPAGEGIHPLRRVDRDEVFELEEDPRPFITPL